MKKRLLFLLLIICFLAAGTAVAQITPEGKIIGKVVDNQGGPLPGVTVEATSPKLVGKASTVTDANGTFRLMALPTGTYEVTFSLTGFKKLARKDIFLEMTQTLVLDVTLEATAIAEEVTVVGQAPLIDVKSTAKGAIMTRDIFMTLPRGRSFDSIIGSLPGVAQEDMVAGITVDGASGAENVFYADGADVTDFHYGVEGQNVVLELLDEVKVTASGYNAEFGGSMGGVINVITRSGSNELHGDVMLFYENNNLWMLGHSRDYLRENIDVENLWEYANDDSLYFNDGKDRDNYYRLEGVFSLGGYIIRDKLWFFGSFNPVYYKTTAQRDFNYREGPFSTFTEKNHDWNGSIKLSAAPAKGLRLSASYINNFNNYRGVIPDVRGNEDQYYEWGIEGYDYPNWTAALSADYTIGNNLLISYRGGWHSWNEKNQQILPPDETTYYFSRSNLGYETDPFYVAHPELLHSRYWTSAGTYREIKNNLKEKISNNLDVSYYLNWMGEHALKVGIGYTYLHENNSELARHPRVVLYFGSTTSALGKDLGVDGDPDTPFYGKYGWYYIRGNVHQPQNGSIWDISANNFSAFIQDSWTIRNRLTINFGLRAEGQVIPAMTSDTSIPGYTADPIKFNIGDALAPRLGAIYDVFGNSSLKVFASYGIYYDVMKLYMASLTFGGWKHLRDYYPLNTLDWPKIAASGAFDDAASQAAGGPYIGSLDYLPPSFGRVDPNLKPTANREISFGAEKKLLEDLSLSVRFVNKHLIRTIEDVGYWEKETLPYGYRWTEKFWICNPGWGWSLPISKGGKLPDDQWPSPKATRDYYGLNISLDKRFSHNWQAGLNYTLSRVAGNYSGLASSDEVGYDEPGVARLGLNTNLYYDDFFLAYDAKANVLEGPLPQDRTHFIKAYGSYVFPFGLTVGATAGLASGFPLTTKLWINDRWILPNNRGDLGRLPWTFMANLYLEYTFKFGDKYRASLNLQIENLFNSQTIQSRNRNYNYNGIYVDNAQFMDGTLGREWKQMVAQEKDMNNAYNLWDTRLQPRCARLGFKFSF